MKRLIVTVFTLVILMVGIVPIVQACPPLPPPPPCPTCVANGDLNVELQVEFIGLPTAVAPGTGYNGWAVGTVSVDPAIIANVSNSAGFAAAGYSYDNYTWVLQDGVYYDGNLSAPANVSATDMGWNPTVLITGPDQIQVWVPIEGTAPMYNGGGGEISFQGLADTYANWYAYAVGKVQCFAGEMFYDIATASWVIRIFHHADLKPVTTDVKGVPPAGTRWADIWTGDLDPNGKIYRWWKNPNWHHNADDLFVWSIYPNGQKPRTMLYRFCGADGTPLAPGPDQVYVVDVPRMADPIVSFDLRAAPVKVMTWQQVEETYGVRP